MLPYQDSGGCRNLIFAIGKNGSSPGTCHEETVLLLPNSYDMGANRGPFAVIVENITFHGTDSKVGNEARGV